MVRQALTAEAIAAIAAGATVAATTAAPAAPSVVPPVAAPAAAVEGEAAPSAAAAPGAVTATPPADAAPAAAAAAAPAAVAAPAGTDVNGFLQAQIITKDAALLANGVEIAGLKAKIADTEASVNGLKAIAASSIINMRVALGGAKTDLSALSATELLAQHEAAKGEFEKKFVAGGVAAVDAAQASKPGAATDIVAQRLNKISA